MNLHNAVLASVFAISIGAGACGSDTSLSDNMDTDSETDSSNPNGGDTATESGVVICDDFHNYAASCGISGQSLTFFDSICSTMDKVFIDSFLGDTMDCLAQESCEDFIALIASTAGDTDTDTDTEARTPDDSFSSCAESSMLTAEPATENADFQSHYCDWVTQCNGEVGELECALYFTDPNSMLAFTILDKPYITAADACVYPMPSCAEDVTHCLSDVTDSISSDIAILSSF